jgi:hypothetical protein
MGSSRTIVASPLLLLALLLLAFAATAEARVVPELFGEDQFQRTCNQVGAGRRARRSPFRLLLCWAVQRMRFSDRSIDRSGHGIC